MKTGRGDEAQSEGCSRHSPNSDAQSRSENGAPSQALKEGGTSRRVFHSLERLAYKLNKGLETEARLSPCPLTSKYLHPCPTQTTCRTTLKTGRGLSLQHNSKSRWAFPTSARFTRTLNPSPWIIRRNTLWLINMSRLYAYTPLTYRYCDTHLPHLALLRAGVGTSPPSARQRHGRAVVRRQRRPRLSPVNAACWRKLLSGRVNGKWPHMG